MKAGFHTDRSGSSCEPRLPHTHIRGTAGSTKSAVFSRPGPGRQGPDAHQHRWRPCAKALKLAYRDEPRRLEPHSLEETSQIPPKRPRPDVVGGFPRRPARPDSRPTRACVPDARIGRPASGCRDRHPSRGSASADRDSPHPAAETRAPLAAGTPAGANAASPAPNSSANRPGASADPAPAGSSHAKARTATAADPDAETPANSARSRSGAGASAAPASPTQTCPIAPGAADSAVATHAPGSHGGDPPEHS